MCQHDRQLLLAENKKLHEQISALSMQVESLRRMDDAVTPLPLVRVPTVANAISLRRHGRVKSTDRSRVRPSMADPSVSS